MSTDKQLAPMETFMERVKGKLRDDIGNMLPDEVVAQMVKRVIEDEFFTAKRVPAPGRSTYSTETIEVPTEFQKMVVEAAKPIIEKHVYRIMVDPETGDVKLERDAPEYSALEEIIDRLFARFPGTKTPLYVENDLWKRGRDEMSARLAARGDAPVPFASAEADGPNYLVAGIPIMVETACTRDKGGLGDRCDGDCVDGRDDHHE